MAIPDEQGEKSAQTRRDRRLTIFLRVVGVADLMALVAVFLPDAVMAKAHEVLGLGTFPEDAIVSYLARSTSLLYAMHGAALLFLSTDVTRYRPAIRFVGAVIAVAGLLLLGVDVYCSLPLWWTLGEAATVVALGITILSLSRQNKDVGRPL